MPVFGRASAPARSYAMRQLANSIGSRDVTAGLLFIAPVKMATQHPASDSERERESYFVAKWNHSDIEDLHDSMPEEEDGCDESDSCERKSHFPN